MEKQKSHECKKAGKVKRLYGKSKSPSEGSQKFMQVYGNGNSHWRKSPQSRSPLGNLENSN